MAECLFCKIVRKEIPAKIQSESEDVVAFHDIHPQAPVHILVIPKVHIVNVLEIESEHSAVVSHLVLMAKEIAKELGLGQTGFRLVLNCGPDAGQAVGHLHLHLLGKRKLHWPPG